ncbi:MAG TPA: NADH-ubiquinone oxidoreductase-F iron-sulfur binding region domain-containing protein [Solirubrobacteraceae bacterium]|nr:NADH-ubiquinone oxidoreductase-F iron-sulfur binding region domain-containing protein [Solirubrobacteraceae bacterium]
MRAGAEGLPRLLEGIPPHGALTLAGHVELHGELPAPTRRGRGGEIELIEHVERSGLRGRGGGGFPAGAKLRAVAAAGGRVSSARPPRLQRPVVVVNGAESEPASAKDRTLLCGLPHLVLDGAELAARAVGAEEIVLAVCETDGTVSRSLTDALAERRRQARRGAPGIRLVTVPGRYVASQETALVNHLNGGPALPTFAPPRPFERGVRRRPTLVSNAETVAHMALILRHGPEWFRELGTPAQPGSALVTLAGTVRYPGVYEIEHGSPLGDLVAAAGGLQTEARAVLLGGYAGAFVGAEHLRGLALSDEHLAPHGATLGAGVVALLSSDACPVAELTRLTRWLAAQSARQCGPCELGLQTIADTVEQVTLGSAERDPHARLRQLASLVRGRGACSHPDGAARLVASAVEVFASELADHARHGPCAACQRPSELPRPRAAGGARRAPAEGGDPAGALSMAGRA